MRRRSLMLEAPRQLRWVAESLPPPAAGEVALRTLFGAVSVGSELPLIAGTHRGTTAVRYPRMTGYESYAEVAAVGSGVEQPRPGDRVVATYGHRTGAVLPVERVIQVPASVAPELALLAILSCDVERGVGRLDPSAGATVLVTGMGAIGLLAVFALALRGIVVDAVEPLPRRRGLALALGARHAVSPEQSAELPVAYDCALECSSGDAAFELLQRMLRREGRICILADGNREPLTLQPVFHEHELTVVGSSDGDDYRAHASWWLPRAAAASSLRALFELHVAARNLGPLLVALSASPRRPLKVLVHYRDPAL